MTDEPENDVKRQLSMRVDGESVPINPVKQEGKGGTIETGDPGSNIKYQAESLRGEAISQKPERCTPASRRSLDYNDAEQYRKIDGVNTRSIDVEASKISGEQMEKAARAIQELNIKTDNTPSRPNADPIDLAQQNQGAAVHNRPQQNPGGPNLPA